MLKFFHSLWAAYKASEISEAKAVVSDLRRSVKSLREQIQQYQTQEDSFRGEICSLKEQNLDLKNEIAALEAVNLGYAVQIRKLQAQEEVYKFEIVALNESHKRLAFLSEASRREAELEIALKKAEIELASATGMGKFQKDKPNGNHDTGGFE